jgi:hypothetical protein
MDFSWDVLLRESVRLASATYSPLTSFWNMTWRQYGTVIDEAVKLFKENNNGGKRR